MNFRTTTALFGLLLLVLWVFGLMLAIKKSSLDDGFVMPKLATVPKDKITYVEIKQGDKTYVFTKESDKGWRLKAPPSEQEVRAEDRKVEDMIDEVRAARHSNAEVGELTRNLDQWGLNPPQITVTLKDPSPGGLDGQFYIGNESGDRAFVYCSSSERKRDVLAVKRSALGSVLDATVKTVKFPDIDTFRVQQLLAGTDATVKKIELTENKDGKTQILALEKNGENNWKFLKPPMGPAEYQATAPTLTPGPAPKGKQTDSVYSLLTAVTSLRAAKFEPINTTIRLDGAKALLRIELELESGKAPKKEKGKTSKEVLLIGGKVPGEEQYYAQLEGDSSVVRVDAKALDSVFALIKDPKVLRSRDVAQFDASEVDAVDIFKTEKDFVKLYRRDKLMWYVFSCPTIHRAKLIQFQSIRRVVLLSAIQGRHEIGDNGFVDADTEQKLKDLEAKFAKDKILATVSVWADSLEPEKKVEPKKDEAKKEEPKKDSAQDNKDANKTDPEGPEEGRKGPKERRPEERRPEERRDPSAGIEERRQAFGHLELCRPGQRQGAGQARSKG